MRPILVFTVVLCSLLFVVAGATATTVETAGRVITASDIDGDWQPFSAPVAIIGIVFTPGAAGDKVVIRQGAGDGPRIVTMSSADGDTLFMRLGVKLMPVVDYSESTLSAGAYVTMFFYK